MGIALNQEKNGSYRTTSMTSYFLYYCFADDHRPQWSENSSKFSDLIRVAHIGNHPFRYAVVAGINLAASFAFLHLMISLAGLNAVLAKVISQAVLFWVTFFLLKQYTFKVSLRARAAREAIRR